MVHYILLACSLIITGLYTASGNAECNLTIIKNIKNKDSFFLGKIDRRHYVEYHVTYINAFKEPVLLEETNTSRFQPMRWFNIHSDVENVLPVTYDFLFNIFERVFHIQREFVEINVTPLNCVHTIDFEKLEELTRDLFLDGTLTNPYICSAHIEDNDGEGRLIFNCCTRGDLCHKVVDHFKWQRILHIISMTATVTILLSVFVLIFSNRSIGTEEFTFQPDRKYAHPSQEAVENLDSLCNVESRGQAAEMLKIATATTAAAKEIIRLVNYITSSTEPVNTYTDNRDQNRNGGLAERVQQATECLRQNETALENIITHIAANNAQNDTILKLGNEALSSVRKAAEIVQRATKELQKSKVSYTFEKSMQAYGAVEKSDKANNEAEKALTESVNSDIQQDEHMLLDEPAKEKLKSAIKNAINAAIEAHATAAILLDSKSEATVNNNKKVVKKQNDLATALLSEATFDKNKEVVEEQDDSATPLLSEATVNNNKEVVEEQDDSATPLLSEATGDPECIKLRVFKERCVDESNLAITFLRCFTEFLTGLNNSFCKTKTNETNSCCSCGCGCRCDCSLRFIFGRILSYVFSSVVLLPFIFLGIEYGKENKDYNDLCAAYKDRGYTCPFNVVEIPKELTWAVVGLYAGAKLLYSCAPINYLKMTVCRVPGCSDNILNCCKKCVMSESCNWYNFFQLCLNILYQMIIYLTWGLSLYTLFYFILSVIFLSSNTKHKWDDIVLIFFPLAVVVYEYIQNVTHKYKVITEKILTLIRTDPEFKCLPREHKGNIAVVLLGANKEIERATEKYGCRERLKCNRPFIFLEANGNVLISKRLVSKIYNDSSESICCEFSAYLKALLLCMLPAFAYGCLLYVLITYISIFSYSNDVAGYVVSVATYLQLIKYKIECFLRDFLLKDSSTDPRFLEKFRKHLNSFTESWTIADDKFYCCISRNDKTRNSA